MDTSGTELYVSPDGSDANPGTEEHPFATLGRAQMAARVAKRGARGPVRVYLRAGTYYLSQPLVLTDEDSGTPRCPVIWSACKGERVVISGGVPLHLQWQPYRGAIMQAQVPGAEGGRIPIAQLFVNGEPQVLARYPNFDRQKRPFGGVADDALSPERVRTWSRPVGALVHGLHRHGWGSVHYAVAGTDVEGHPILAGGQQMNREGGMGPNCFVENVFEELDAPGEWFLDHDSGTLYLYPSPGVSLASSTVEAAILKELIVCRGSEQSSVRHLHFRGLEFTHTASTVFEPYDMLLRGDWSIARRGAIRLAGAEDCSIERCTFAGIGGNGVFLSGYNRRVRVACCRFAGVGDSAICLVGDISSVRSPSTWEHQVIDPPDKTPGPATASYPAQCVVENNLIHNTGVTGKQTAGVFISMAEEITVRHNTIYHVPRAGICINDGCWGGHVIEHNDVFDTVRETGDHGPFNSWGRDRHWSSGSKALALLDHHKTTIIRHNRFSHWGSHSWGIDLDDGSSNYHIYGNLTLGCSIKLREGYFRLVENNICIGPHPISKHCCYPENEDVIRRNIYVNTAGGEVLEFIHGDPSQVQEIDHNLYWNPQLATPVVIQRGRLAQGCAQSTDLADWQAGGLDAHSLFADPHFVDPVAGDYRVCEGSPALELGFKNFAMDVFGVQDAALRLEAQEGHRTYDVAQKEVVKALTGRS